MTREIEWRQHSPTLWVAMLGGADVGYVSRTNRYPVLGEWEATTTAPYARSSLLTFHKLLDEGKAAVAQRISEGFAPFLEEPHA